MEVLSVRCTRKTIYNYPVHSHGCWEILYQISGVGVITIEGRKHSISPGDIVILPPNISHGTTAVGGFCDMSMLVKEMQPIGDERGKIITDDESRTILELLQIAERCYQKLDGTEKNRSFAVINSLGESVYQLLCSFYARNTKRDSRLDKIIERMEANVSNPDFDLSAEIDNLGYSKGYFRKLFKDDTGESPVHFFNRLRIEQAKKIFSTYGKERSIKDVSMSCGFTDAYYFSRMFKKITGVSPQYYVNNINEFDMRLI